MGKFEVILVMAIMLVFGFVTATSYSKFKKCPTYPVTITESTIQLTVDDTRCIGLAAAPPGFIGAPPRVWLCENQPPWYDATGVKLPNKENRHGS